MYDKRYAQFTWQHGHEHQKRETQMYFSTSKQPISEVNQLFIWKLVFLVHELGDEPETGTSLWSVTDATNLHKL
jgi:hypothetical protein